MKLSLILLFCVCLSLTVSACVVEPYGEGRGYHDEDRGHRDHDEDRGHRVWHE